MLSALCKLDCVHERKVMRKQIGVGTHWEQNSEHNIVLSSADKAQGHTMPTWDFPAGEGYALCIPLTTSFQFVHTLCDWVCAPRKSDIARPKGLPVQSKHVRQEELLYTSEGRARAATHPLSARSQKAFGERFSRSAWMTSCNWRAGGRRESVIFTHRRNPCNILCSSCWVLATGRRSAGTMSSQNKQ